jgi:serine/threonine protein kinase
MMDAFDGIKKFEMMGNYKLRKPLATGMNSQVYEVVELNSNMHFAMKLLLPEKVGDEELRKDLMHEADVARGTRIS